MSPRRILHRFVLLLLLLPLCAYGQFMGEILTTGEALKGMGGVKSLGETLGVKMDDVGAQVALLGMENQYESAKEAGLKLESNGEWKKAVISYKEAVDLLERIRRTTREDSARESLMETGLDVYVHLVKLLLRLNAPEDAFSYAERSKARSFLDQLAESGAEIRAGVDPELLTEEASLYDRLGDIRKKLRDPRLNEKRAEEKRAAYVKEERDLEQRIEFFEKRLRFNNPRYAALKYPKPVTADQIRAKLVQNNAILLEYMFGQQELFLFVIDKNSIHVSIIPADVRKLSAEIERLVPAHAIGRGEVKLAKQVPSDDDVYYDLYGQLLQPAEPYFSEKKTLLIVPDGVLYYLPFEMLHVRPPYAEAGAARRRSKSYLIERYAIAYAPSASVWEQEAQYSSVAQGKRKTLLAMAPFAEKANHPILPNRLAQVRGLPAAVKAEIRKLYLNRLPYSEKEVEEIGKLFGSTADFLLGESATKQVMVTKGRNYRYLHLATHGFVDSKYPMYSGLAFYNSLLQTYEVFNLQLEADLVTLSACETGLGQLRTGEGMVGLARAFMYAGTPSVVVSLWSVNDEATSLVMTAFYRNLRAGMNKGEALRRAKISMIESGSNADTRRTAGERYSDPFFWAAFVLVGDWGVPASSAD